MSEEGKDPVPAIEDNGKGDDENDEKATEENEKEEKVKNMEKQFYKIVAAMCLIMVVLVLVIGIFDIFKLIFDKIVQYASYNENNPNLYTKDTISSSIAA